MSTTIRITARRDDADHGATEQRSALLRRIAVAGMLIALLIGGLAVFDASRRANDDEDEPLTQAAPPVASAPAVAAPAPPPEETPAVGVLPAALQDSPPPLPEGDAPPSAEAVAQPAAEARGNGTPPVAPSKAGGAAPSSPQAPAAEPAVPESTARPGVPAAAPEAAGVRRPVDRAARAEAAAPGAAPPPLTRSPAGGYVVQAGVFSQTTNAEELRARLALHGIPAQIETRVLVGPFRSRAEADRARAQMRALGIDGAPPAAR